MNRECSVCGTTLRECNTTGVCGASTGDCRRERKRIAKGITTPRRFCLVCGDPVQENNLYSVCARNPACRAERWRLKHPQKSPEQLKGPEPEQPKRAFREKKKTCIGCGTPLLPDNTTGYCRTKPECMAAVTEMARLATIDPDRKCLSCSGPISKYNKTGYCIQTHDCRLMGDRVRKGKNPVLKPRVLIDHNPVISDDGYIDETAVQKAVNGIKVRLTPTEQRAVIERMLKMPFSNMSEIRVSARLGHKEFKAILDDMGYEIILDPLDTDMRRLITRKDRSKEKMLDGRPGVIFNEDSSSRHIKIVG